MILVFFVGLIVVGIFIGLVLDWDELGCASFSIGFFCLVFSAFILILSYAGLDGFIAKRNVHHDMLVYQYENDIYENDNDLGKRELMMDIQEWNEWLATKQEDQDDFWFGIFIPNIYDQFEFIELKGD